MKKRLPPLLLTLALTLTLFSLSAHAQETGLTITEVIPCQYDRIGPVSEGLLAVEKDGKSGFIDTAGRVVIPLTYDNARSFSEGLAAVYLDGGEEWWNSQWLYIDRQGNTVITPREPATIVWGFQEGRAVVHTRLGEMLIDKTGKELVAWDRDYEEIRSCSDGMLRVKKNGRYGFLNAQGEEVIPCVYEYAEDFSEGLAAVRRDYSEGWVYVDKTGRQVIGSDVPELPYYSAGAFSGGLAVVTRKSFDGGTQSTYIDCNGTRVIDGWYPVASQVSEGLAVMTEGFNFGALHSYLLDVEQGVATELERDYFYSRMRPFSEGMALVENQSTDKWGFINRNGLEVIRCQYDYDDISGADGFSDGVMRIRDGAGGKYGYIDRVGRQVLPYTYDEAETFSEGLAIVGQRDPVSGRMSYGLIAVGETDQPAPPPLTAYASTQSIRVFGTPVEFRCYALKDENGYDTNYVRIRDLALALNGTAAQFNVDWNGTVVLQTKTPYTPNGSENSAPFSGDQPCQKLTEFTIVNGESRPLDGIVITDDQGGAYTYYQLRELITAVRFQLNWSAEKGIEIPWELHDRFPNEGKIFFETK